MRLFRSFLLGLLALTLVGIPTGINAEGSQFVNNAVSATQVNTAVSFGFVAYKMFVSNDGNTNSIYVDLKDTTAVATTDFEIKPGEAFTWAVDKNEPGWSGVGIICAAGLTSTARVGAWATH